MSDATLRVKIADAIFTAGAVYDIIDAYTAADAVLKKLNLHWETRPGIVRANGRFIDGPTETRYVTYWTADE